MHLEGSSRIKAKDSGSVHSKVNELMLKRYPGPSSHHSSPSLLLTFHDLFPSDFFLLSSHIISSLFRSPLSSQLLG